MTMASTPHAITVPGYIPNLPAEMRLLKVFVRLAYAEIEKHGWASEKRGHPCQQQTVGGTFKNARSPIQGDSANPFEQHPA